MGRTIARQLGACFLLVTASGCLSHQSRNSIRRAWVDFNSLGQPAIVFEQTDHLPYHAEQVGHFLWMYGSTPGHHNLYKARRYQKDLLAGEAVPAGSVSSEELVIEADPTGQGELPSDVNPSEMPVETTDSLHPPPPPVDLPASPRKNPARPADTPPPPPLPAPPQPVGPSAQKSPKTTNRKPSLNRWTASRKPI